MSETTIFAPATAVGRAGVCIIRVSGGEAHRILDDVFTPLDGKDLPPRELVLGNVHNGDTFIDRSLAVKFFAPNSFTGEDVAEVHCHGGYMTAKLVMKAVMDAGAVPAEPGEFSKRAFLNGKMDISQAEAIQDIVSSMSETGALVSARNLKGDIFAEISDIQDRLKRVIASVQAGIEYPEEDIEDDIAESQIPVVKELADRIGALEDTYKSGKLIREGVHVAIAGNTNVGKSSLLNAFLGEDRAIVTEIPGTTRDILTEVYDLNGLPIIFHDTAGIRETDDAVEKIGVDRAKKTFSESTVVLFVFDSSKKAEEDEIGLLLSLKEEGKTIIPVLNKADLGDAIRPAEIEKLTGLKPEIVSASEKTGIDALLKKLYNTVLPDESLLEGVVISNARHVSALKDAERSLRDAIKAFNDRISLDCVTIDLNAAWSSLGEITGESLTEDIIDTIFSEFCLGK